MSTGPSQPPIRFTGCKSLINRLVLSTLTGRPIRISQVRSTSISSTGFAPHEVSFLRLLDSITNGSSIDLDYTGTTLVYRPGLITGSAPGLGTAGGVLRHELEAGCTRGVSYFLLPLCLLAPFSKAPVNVIFTGAGCITSATPTGDISADAVRTAILPLFAQFGVERNIELRILKRSCPGPGGKGGAGEVQLIFGHQVRLPKTLHLMNPGRVKKIRGVAYATGVAAANNARMIESARGVLNELCKDTFIASDVSPAPLLPSQDRSNPGAKRKLGIGFGILLVAETSTGCLYSADVGSPPEGGEPPESVGRQCAFQLLETVAAGGCVSKVAAPTMLMLMAMGDGDVGRLQMGRNVVGSEEIIGLGRDLREFGCSAWGLRDAGGGSEDIVVSIVGRGVGNVGRKIA
ncbi:RNA 3'-terminal phosphate cyclase [Lophium mytilinum]|uniref:RNA 3'-terminal phosphate cyclase n=1 Tax=Lophium mytilinum TaxID=390894 RepID=A0A6A6QX24_9PEZI|nr:RNA 3'-terminal phosphate cyclase [Lophium mytilinum]